MRYELTDNAILAKLLDQVDQLTGAVLMTASVVIFTYYTVWTIILVRRALLLMLFPSDQTLQGFNLLPIVICTMSCQHLVRAAVRGLEAGDSCVLPPTRLRYCHPDRPTHPGYRGRHDLYRHHTRAHTGGQEETNLSGLDIKIASPIFAFTPAAQVTIPGTTIACSRPSLFSFMHISSAVRKWPGVDPGPVCTRGLPPSSQTITHTRLASFPTPASWCTGVHTHVDGPPRTRHLTSARRHHQYDEHRAVRSY